MLKVGTKVKALVDHSWCWLKGDIGVIVDVSDIGYTVDFSGQGNEKVVDEGIWFVNFRDVEACEYTSEELEQVIFDVLEGKRWYEIQEDTGLDETRCKEIEKIVSEINKKLGF
jgi:hypothetical protein